MSWYDPTTWLQSPDQGQDEQRRGDLLGQAANAGNFANQATGQFNDLARQGNAALGQLQATANGQNSVSMAQLGQANQQSLAQQQSIAAGAAPQNAAMAARTAAIQSGRLSSGLAGQQAVAGLQERNQAQQQYAQLLQGLRGQDTQAALGAQGNAINGYSAGAYGQQNPSGTAALLGFGLAGAQAAAQFGSSPAGKAAMSDRRLKTEIKDGSEAADTALKGLKAHFFRYKNEKHGAGPRVGIMAQDLERAGLGHAVIETREGKAVHGAHLATALAAMMPGIDKRLAKLEGGDA